jgi:hypothetical protein
MRKVIISAFVFMGLIWGMNAHAITMTFETLYQHNDGYTFITGPYEESGFTLTASNPDPYSFGSAGDLNVRFGGSTAITTFNYGFMTLKSSSGGTFDLLSLDVAPVTLGAGDPFGVDRVVGELYQTTLYGLRGDGSFVSQVINLPNTTSANVLTLTSIIGFTGLTEVVLLIDTLPGIQIDNIVLNNVSSVPEPNSIIFLLLGMSLIVLARSVRKKAISI